MSKRDLAGIHAWLNDWAACVRAVDYAAARQMFDTDVVSFGTRFTMMRGLDELERQQWRGIWPVTSGFRFKLKQMRCTLSGDRRLACVISPWSSSGKRASGHSFARSGRATILLQRKTLRSPWQATHTHLSLSP